MEMKFFIPRSTANNSADCKAEAKHEEVSIRIVKHNFC